jgi:hypothetical protein
VVRNVLIAVLEWLAIWNCRALTPLRSSPRTSLCCLVSRTPTLPAGARRGLSTRNGPRCWSACFFFAMALLPALGIWVAAVGRVWCLRYGGASQCTHRFAAHFTSPPSRTAHPAWRLCGSTGRRVVPVLLVPPLPVLPVLPLSESPPPCSTTSGSRL